MSHQRSDRAVVTEAAKQRAVAEALRGFLRRCGIRSLHSPKARQAIARAHVKPLSTRKAETEEVLGSHQ